MQGVFIYIGDNEPPGSPSDGWIWVDTANKVIKVYQGYADGAWIEKQLDIPVTVLLRENVTLEKDITVRDISVSRNLIADDQAGLTQVVTLSGVTKLKFKKGILYEVE